jgi:predicted Rossmann-fold nucleotide-binding protein
MYRDPYSVPFDLVSPDGKITKLQRQQDGTVLAIVDIDNIFPNFLGFTIGRELLHFNLKSTIAQLGVDAEALEIDLSATLLNAQLNVKFFAVNDLGKKLLSKFVVGMYVGKLFAADDRRRVRYPAYIQRIFNHTDRKGHPLINFGEEFSPNQLIFQEDSTRTIVKLPIREGRYEYTASIEGLLDTVALGLKKKGVHLRSLLTLHQEHLNKRRKIGPGRLLLVKTVPLYMRTLFARVINDELPKGVRHSTANILEPHIISTCEIYELYGDNNEEVYEIPLEFYTLEPYREHVFFEDRDLLKESLEDTETILRAFDTAPEKVRCASFIVKGDQLKNLKKEEWIVAQDTLEDSIAGPPYTDREMDIINQFIQKQPAFPILQGIHNDNITSEGVLFTRYFPSTFLKRLLINARVRECLKAIYFQHPSHKYGDYFSAEDRSMLRDFANASIDIYWANPKTKLLTKYVPKKGKVSGMFVPIPKIKAFQDATVLGFYGSNLMGIDNEEDLKEFLHGVLKLRQEVNHPLLHPKKELMVLTGGGPGIMEVGNRLAVELGILSGGNSVDFSNPPYSGDPIHKQVIPTEDINPYIQAIMTYRLEQIIYRQAEFHLDLACILKGGTGTDFEFALENLRTQAGLREYTVPVILFGTLEYWENKISTRFKQNLESGTVKESEWVSNTFFLARNAAEALDVYSRYFKGILPIGSTYKSFNRGFRLYNE